MKKPKKNIRPSLLQGPGLGMIDWENPKMHLPSTIQCRRCFSNLQKLFSEIALEFSMLPVENRIALLTDIIQKKKLLKSLFSENDNEFFELKLSIEQETLKHQENVLENQPSISVIELLALLGLKRILVKGPMKEVCMKWGEFVFHTRNSKGELMFDTEAVDLARLIEVIVEPPPGKECLLHTIEGYVGEGRNS